jgi:HKD family nuclease
MGWDRSLCARRSPEEFDFLAALGTAKTVRLAVAFGHMSGWEEIAESLTESGASKIQILLGQAFFQTEPALILALKALQESSSIGPAFEVKLASAVTTFHPKVWIVENNQASFGIVGSGNLSRGGLLRNVECSLYTDDPTNIAALRGWFERQWAAAPPFRRTYEEYIRNHHNVDASRKNVDAKIKAATTAQADREATWRQRQAIRVAGEYWRTAEGKQEVEAREAAIAAMRALLDYPAFDFGVNEWRQFLRIPELGRIRLGHEKKTIEELPKLKALLRKLAKSTSPTPSVEALQSVAGIGRNLATKLLAMHRPDKFVVINEPVESALLGFGYELEMSHGVTSATYERFLKDLAPFIEECEAAHLRPAAALDAFFYDYRDRGFADES